MIICLLIGVLPRLELRNVKAADAELEDPLKDLVFDDSNTVTLDLFDGSYINIYEDGYTQSSSNISSTTATVSFKGNYIIKGVTSGQIVINKKSGTSDIKLSKITSSNTAVSSLNISSDTNMFIDTYIKLAKYLAVYVAENINFNLKGNSDKYDQSDTISGGMELPRYTLGKINVSNLKVSDGFSINSSSTSTKGGILGIYNCELNGKKGSEVRSEFYYNKLIFVNSTLRYFGFYINGLDCKMYNVDIILESTHQNYIFNATLDKVKIEYLGYKFSGINHAIPASKINITGTVTNSEFVNINAIIGQNKTISNSYNVIKTLNSPNDYKFNTAGSVKYHNFTKIFEISNVSYTYSLDSCISIFDKVSFGGHINNTDELMNFIFIGKQSYVNTEGDYVYPTAIKVEGYQNCYVTLETDEWDEGARFLLDSYGYIYPWLTWGDHTVKVSTEDGKTVETTVTADNSTTPNSVTATPVGQVPTQKVNVEKENTNVKFKFDSGVYVDSISDVNGDVEVPITVGSSKFTIKLDEGPTIVYTAEVVDDVIGTLTKVFPSIASQSSSASYVAGDNMVLYVNAKESDSTNSLSYEWYKDGILVPNITTNVFNNTVTDDTYGTYVCKVSESNGMYISSEDIVISKGSTSITEDKYKELENKYTELQDNFNDLKNSYAALVIENTGNEEVITSLRDKIAELEQEIADLNSSIVNKDKTIADLSSTITNLTNTIDSYKSLLESIRIILNVSTNDEIIPKIQEIITQLESLRNDYSDLNDEYEEYKDNVQATIDSLTEQLKKLQEQLDSSSVELDDVKKQLADVLIQSTDLRSLLDLIKAELGVTEDSEIIPAIQDLKRKYNDLRDLYNQLVIENSSNSTTIITLTERITELESLITILEKDAQDNADTIKNLQNRVSDLISEVESYKTLIESIKTLLGANSNEEIVHKIQEMLDDLSELKKDYVDLSQSYDDYKTVAQEKITELQERISSLEKELADGNIELGVVKDQLVAAMIQITDLTSLIDEIKRELDVDSNEEIIPAIQELKRKYMELKTKYDEIVIENNTNSTTIVTLTERISELETIINNLESDATTNSATIKELQDRITEMTTKINEYETLVESLKIILEVTTDDEIISKIQEILKQLDDVNKDYEELSNEYNEYKVSAANKLQELTLKLTQLEQDLINKNIELDIVKRELADALAQITDLRSLVNDIKTELGVTDDTEIIPAIKVLKDRITGLEVQVTGLQEQLKSANDIIADLTKDKNDYNKRIEDMKDLVDVDSSDDIESKIQHMKDLIVEYEEKITQLEEDKSDLEKVISVQQKEIQDLKDALNGNTQDLLDRISELEKKVQDLENRNTEISSQIDVLNQSINNLTIENTELKKQVLELKTQLDIANSTIEELRKKVIDLTVENELLKEENVIIKAENEDLKKHECPSNEDLIKEIEKLKKEIEILKNNTSSNIVTVPDNSVVVTPTTDTKNIIEQTNDKVSAESGWELNTSLDKGKWADEVPIENLVETTGTFTFFTGKDLAKAFSSYVEKTVVYARKKSDPNNVYVCSFNIDKGVASYSCPTGSMSSDTKGVTFVYDESNTKVVNTTGKVTFNVDGDFGVVGKKGIYYKVVAVQNDFDPDGSWTEVKGNTFIVDINEQVRVYIKYVDNYGNYTVNKTTVLDSSKHLDVPVLQFNKTIYLNYSYKLQLDTKGNNVMYKSSDKLVATVDENGLVTAKYNGKAKINCTVFDEKGVLLYRYEVLVTVKESNDKTLSLKKNYSANGTNDVILQSYKLISKGKTTKLSVKADKDAKVMYVTSDKSVATVTSKGIVTGKAKGSADITVVVYQNDKFYTYVVKVRVTDGTKDKGMKNYLK